VYLIIIPMKAILLREYGSSDNFELSDVPIPAIGCGQIRIKIKAVSFNPVDFQIRKGYRKADR